LIITSNILENECKELLNSFFFKLRSWFISISYKILKLSYIF
jgi:hypothetical protein